MPRRDRSWTSSTAKKGATAPLVALLLSLVVVNAVLALWIANSHGKAPVAGPPTSVPLASEAFAANIGDAEPEQPWVTIIDPEGVVHDDGRLDAELHRWLSVRGVATRTLATARADTGISDDTWKFLLEVEGADDDVLASRATGEWVFSWATPVMEAEARAKEREERARMERAARAAEEAEGAAEAPANESSATATDDPDAPQTVTIEYVPISDVGWLSAYLPEACAEALASQTMSWAAGVPGLRNASSAYLVSDSVSGEDPCTFTIVVPSGTLDDSMEWSDVSVPCTWSGGYLSLGT